MGSDTLSYIKQQLPSVANLSDDELTQLIAQASPESLQTDTALADDYNRLNPQGFMANLGEGFIKGAVYDLPSAFIGLAEAGVGLIDDKDTLGLSALADDIDEAGLNYARRNNLDLDSWGAAIGGGASSLIPIFKAGVAANWLLKTGSLAAKTKARISQGAVLATVGAQSFGGNFREAKENYESQGLSSEEATKSAYIPALASATAEVGMTLLGGAAAKGLGLDDVERTAASWLKTKEAKAAISGIADTVQSNGKSALTKTRRVLGSAFIEGSEEAGAAIADSIVAVMSHSPDLTFSQAAEGVWKNFVVGSILGGGMSTLQNILPDRAEDLEVLSDEQIAQVERTRAYGNEQTAAALEKKFRLQNAGKDAEAQAAASTAETESQEVAVAQNVDPADAQVVAKFLGVPVSELTQDGKWTPVPQSEQAKNKIKFASDEKRMQWEDNEQTLSPAQQQLFNSVLKLIEFDSVPIEDRPSDPNYVPRPASSFDSVVSRWREERGRRRMQRVRDTDTGVNQTVIPEGEDITSYVDAATGLPTTDRATATQVDPDQNLNIVDMARMSSSEINPIAEAALGGTELSPTNRTAVDRMLNRKAELLGQLFADEPVRARGVPLDTEAETDVINEIKDIDSNLASILGVSAPAAVTRAEARQFVESVDQKLQSAEQEIEPEPTPVVESAQLDVSGDSVEVIGAVDEGMQKSLRSALSKAKKRLGSLVNLKRIVATELSGGAGAASAARRGRRSDLETILIDPVRLAERMKRGNFDLSKVLEEELLHNLDGKAIRHLYNQKRKRGELSSEVSFRQFFEDHHQQIADQMTGEEQAAARKFYGEDFRDPVHMAQEFIRQLLQKRHTKVITEEAMGNPLIRAIIRAIHYAYGKVKVTKGLLKTHLDNASSLLVEIQKDPITVEQEAPATVSQPTPEATTIEDVGKDDELDVEESEDAEVEESEKKRDRRPVISEDQQEQDEVVAYYAMHQIVRMDQRNGRLLGDQGPEAVANAYLKRFKREYDKDTWSVFFSNSVERLRNPEDVKKAFSPLQSDNQGNTIWPTMSPEALSAVRAILQSEKTDVARRYTRQMRDVTRNTSGDATIGEESETTIFDTVEASPQRKDYLQAGLDAIAFLKANREKLNASDIELYVMAQKIMGVESHAEIAANMPSKLGKHTEKNISKKYRTLTNKIAAASEKNPEFIKLLKEELYPANAPASDPSKKLINDILSMIPNPAKKLFVFLKGAVIDPLKGVKPVDGSDPLNFTYDRIKKDGYINKTVRFAAQRARDLENAIKLVYSGGITDDQRAEINEHLNGVGVSKLPQKITDAVADMRVQIDNLTNYMLDNGMVDEKLVAKLEENIGMYLARSYAIFDNKNYKPSSEVEQKAVNYIAQRIEEIEEISSADAVTKAQNVVSNILADMGQTASRDSYMKGKLGAKDLSLFRKKNEDLAPEIRALMGEYTDPVVNYMRTISRMAHYVGNQQFLKDMLARGENKVFFDESDLLNRPKMALEKVAGGEAYSPLNNFRTTPEMNQLLRTYGEASAASKDGLWATLIRINASIKAFKTVGSVMTTMRNYISQPFHLIHNGYWDVTEWKDAAVKASKSIIADASGTDRDLQAYYNEGVQLGLAGEDMTTAELRKTLEIYGSVIDESNTLSEWLNKGMGKMLKDMAFKGKDKATLFYQSADTIGKLVAWEMEQAKLRKLPSQKGKSPQAIREEAAKRVRMTMPTYSELPQRLQEFRRQPLVGDFMSFAYEAMRTQINNIKLIKDEWKNNTTESKSYALQRAAGLMFVTASYSAFFKALSSMWGDVDEEEQKEVRSLMAPWEKNSTFLFSRNKEGELNYINFSYDNPYSATTDAIMSLMPMLGIGDRPVGGTGEQVSAIMKQVLNPFLGESLLANAIVDVSRNSDDFGNRIWQEDQNGGEQAASIIGHLFKAVNLGTFDRAYNRWLPAYYGETLRSGEKPTLKREMISEAIGLRLRTLDYKDKLGKQSYSNNDRLQVANRIFTRLAGGEGTVSDSDLLISYRSANNARRRVFADIKRQVNAARASGLSDREIKTSLTQYMTDKDAKAVMRGQFVPYKVSPQLKKKAKGADRKLPLTDLTQIYREFAREDLEN